MQTWLSLLQPAVSLTSPPLNMKILMGSSREHSHQTWKFSILLHRNSGVQLFINNITTYKSHLELQNNVAILVFFGSIIKVCEQRCATHYILFSLTR